MDVKAKLNWLLLLLSVGSSMQQPLDPHSPDIQRMIQRTHQPQGAQPSRGSERDHAYRQISYQQLPHPAVPQPHGHRAHGHREHDSQLMRVAREILPPSAQQAMNSVNSIRSDDYPFPTLQHEVPCAICLSQTYSTGRHTEEARRMTRVVTSCGHSFHKRCLAEALVHSRACPMCRQNLSEDVVLDQDNLRSEVNDLAQERGARLFAWDEDLEGANEDEMQDLEEMLLQLRVRMQRENSRSREAQRMCGVGGCFCCCGCIPWLAKAYVMFFFLLAVNHTVFEGRVGNVWGPLNPSNTWMRVIAGLALFSMIFESCVGCCLKQMIGLEE